MKGLLLVLGALLMSHNACADGLDGEKTVFLGNAAGERVAIGRVTFTPMAVGRRKIKFTLDPNRFEEYFLAMNPSTACRPRAAACATSPTVTATR